MKVNCKNPLLSFLFVDTDRKVYPRRWPLSEPAPIGRIGGLR